MHDFAASNADEMYYDELARRVRFHKQDERGVLQKAIEAAITAIKKYKASPEDAAKDMNAPLELVREALNQKK